MARVASGHLVESAKGTDPRATGYGETRKFWAALLLVLVLREVLKVMEEHEVYTAIGQEGFERLVSAFYRQVPGDSILGPMYQGRDLAAAEARLRGFLVYRFGGPQTYIEERGHPRLRMRHNPFVINQAARESWMKLMTVAMDEVKLPADAREVLQNFFDSTATFLINRPM